MRTLTSRIAAVTLMSSLALAGCGGSDSGSDSDKSEKTPSSSASSTAAAPTSDVEPANGKTITGAGYSYSLPEGWDLPKKKIPGTEATDTFAADLTDTDGFADNINVIKQSTIPPKPIGEFKDELGDQLKAAGGQNVEVKEVGQVAGEESLHISSTQGADKILNLTEQYFVVHDGSTYFITFSHSPDVSEQDRADVAQSVLATWKWSA